MRLLSRFSRLLFASLGTIASVAGSPASAQTSDQGWLRCQNEEEQFSIAAQIASCTAIIEAKRENLAKLSLAYSNRGNARRKGSQPDFAGAISDYDNAISLDSQNVNAFASRGYTYQYGRSPNFDRAIADYSAAIALRPDYAWLFYNRGNAYLTAPKPNFQKAIADYSQAVTINPNYAYAFSNRGLAYQRGSHPDFAKAIADHSHAIRLYPQGANAYSNRSLAYLGGATPDFAAAIADSDKAAELQPDNADFQHGRCWARAVAGQDLKVARAACDRALELTPNNPDVLDSRGVLNIKEERWQDAWNDYNDAIQANSANSRHYYGRGIAAVRMGRRIEGESDLARAKQMDSEVEQSFSKIGISP